MIERHRRQLSVMLRVVLVSTVLTAPLAQAVLAQDSEDQERAEDMAREGMERIMRALELFMDSIPQYELPEVNEHGDIIIRRKRHFDDRAPKASEEESDAAET